MGHLQAGDPARAAGYLLRYLQLDPGSVSARVRYAAALALSGRREEAHRILTEVLASAPSDPEARRALEELGK